MRNALATIHLLLENISGCLASRRRIVCRDCHPHQPFISSSVKTLDSRPNSRQNRLRPQNRLPASRKKIQVSPPERLLIRIRPHRTRRNSLSGRRLMFRAKQVTVQSDRLLCQLHQDSLPRRNILLQRNLGLPRKLQCLDSNIILLRGLL